MLFLVLLHSSSSSSSRKVQLQKSEGKRTAGHRQDIVGVLKQICLTKTAEFRELSRLFKLALLPMYPNVT